MAKLIKLVITVGILGAIAYGVFVVVQNMGSGNSNPKDGSPMVRPEEKVGVTTETFGG